MITKDFLNNISDKRICVLGMGISNFPLIRFLLGKGAADITVIDKNDKTEMLEKEGLSLKTVFGENYLSALADNNFDVIFKTPVVRYDLPEIQDAVSRGALLTSEMEVFLNLCPCKIFAITGSDGKTTTTTLTYLFLKAYAEKIGVNAFVGGNIGTPLLPRLDEMTEKDFVIVELSSFQLMNMHAAVDVAVVTNITPNHLDVHKSYEEYIDAKKQIFENATVTVLNDDNDVTKSLENEIKGELRVFSRKHSVKNGAYFTDGNVRTTNGDILPRNGIKLPGNHNVENYMAAICAVMNIVPFDIILKTAAEFGGVEHRLEFVRELDGVKYYNSSIDSSPNRTINALSVFDKKNIVLIAGGKDKGIPYDALGPALCDKVKAMILTGPTAKLIEKSALDEFSKRGKEPDLKIIHACNYQEAVPAAKAEAEAGDIVLLSPASTSFDMFKNFEERGNIFKNLVINL